MRRVHVATLSGRASVRTIRSDVVPSPTSAELLFVTLPRRSLAEDTSDLIYSVPEKIRGVSQAIILRAHRYEAEQFLRRESRSTSKLLDRFKRLPIYLLHWNGEDDRFNLTPLSDSGVDLGDDTELIKDLRSADVLSMQHSPGAVLPANGSFHYLAPNGKHYRSFLRVGSAVQSQDALDSVAFWLLPYVRDKTVVLLDSQTIAPIGLNLAQYIQDLDFHHDRSVVSIDSLRGYNETDADELRHRLILVHPKDAQRRHALAITSVASTGTLARTLREIATSVGFHEADGVALYAGPQAVLESTDRFAELPLPHVGYEPGDCKACEGSRDEPPSVRVRINPDTFHVEVAQAVTHRRLIRDDALAAKRFLTRYAGLDAIRAHRTEVGGHGRHHALYIDGAKLLKDRAFRSRLQEIAKELSGSVDLVIVPNHPAAVAIADETLKTLDCRRVVCDEDQLAKSGDRDAIVRAKQILIIDDVAITGDRIRGYRQFLMEIGRAKGPVHVLVAVSRPSSNDAKQAIRNLVDQMGPTESTFHAVEEVVLPDWDREDCPWCWERRLLKNWSPAYPDLVPISVTERVLALSDTEHGLKDNLFWTWDGERLVLGDGSIFAPVTATEAELVFAVASALQAMRADGRLDEEFLPPVAKLLKHEFWARGRFYAPAITAAILRMAKPHDLVPPIPRRSLSTAIDERLFESASHGLRTEILLAAANGKLPLTTGAATLIARSSGSLCDVLRDLLTIDAIAGQEVV